tara:strand:- start:141 stop:437 length:297 start_codon:yes stop_codon:yes gene_type:complete
MYNTRIEMTKTDLIKNPNTKTTYLVDKVERSTIRESEYNNILNSVKFFRRLGGAETEQKKYTRAGYLTYKLTSTSPNRERKTIREFEFIEDKRYKYNR